MDSTLLQTFLEVSRTRHFGRAAQNLFVTQSAVGARIRLLEQQLGAALFARNHRELVLTAAGARFMPHAEAMVAAWRHACRDVGRGATATDVIAVGGAINLWEVWLSERLTAYAAPRPGIRWQCHAATAGPLLERLRLGELDVAYLMHSPAPATDLVIHPLQLLEFVLVGAGPELVMADWGEGFLAQASDSMAGDAAPVITGAPLGLVLHCLAKHACSAWLPMPLATSLIREGKARPVASAGSISRGIFAVHLTRQDFIPRQHPALLEPGHPTEAGH